MALILTVTEVGSDVVFFGEGSLNLLGLNFVESSSIGPGYEADTAIWAVGSGGDFDAYDGVNLTYPSNFGSGTDAATSGDGSIFGILTGGASGRVLIVPSGYTSGTYLSGSCTFSTNTIVGMGLIPGTYVYNWGSGTNMDSLIFVIGSIIDANQQYEYSLEILGNYSGGTTDFPGAYAPHPIYTNALGQPVQQLNAITIGGFNGLNN